MSKGHTNHCQRVPTNFTKKKHKSCEIRKMSFSAIIHPYQLLSLIPKIPRNLFHPFPRFATSQITGSMRHRLVRFLEIEIAYSRLVNIYCIHICVINNHCECFNVFHVTIIAKIIGHHFQGTPLPSPWFDPGRKLFLFFLIFVLQILQASGPSCHWGCGFCLFSPLTIFAMSRPSC